MSKMAALVDELRQQLNTVREGEQELVASLREALDQYDQRLLQDVRNLAAEHEARRGAILCELQSLARRMGAFPPPREPHLELTDGTPPMRATPPALPRTVTAQNGKLHAVEGGAWREATQRLQSELEGYFRKRA
jgi:non-ribosomal peptide synthetase component F